MNATTAATAAAKRAEVAINEIIRVGKSHSTKAVTNVERAGDAEHHWLGIDEEWAVVCVTHGEFVGVDSRREACLMGAHPESFCSACDAILTTANVAA